MNKKEIVEKGIINNGGIAKTADFAAEGIKNYEVAAFCKEGYIERICRGFYRLPHSSQISEEQLLQVLNKAGQRNLQKAVNAYATIIIKILRTFYGTQEK